MLCHCSQVQQLRISSNTTQYQTIQTHLHNGGPNFLLVIWIGKAGKSGGCGFYWVGTNCSKCVLVWRRRLPSWLALAQCTRTTHKKSQLLDHLILKSCNTQNIPRFGICYKQKLFFARRSKQPQHCKDTDIPWEDKLFIIIVSSSRTRSMTWGSEVQSWFFLLNVWKDNFYEKSWFWKTSRSELVGGFVEPQPQIGGLGYIQTKT